MSLRLWTLVVVCLGWGGLAGPARAHFLWIETGGDEPAATLSFAEEPGPGAAHLVDRIAKARAWATAAGGRPVELVLEPRVDHEHETAVIRAPLDVEGPLRVEARHVYGVHEIRGRSVLLTYYAKAVDCPRAEQLAELARGDKLALDAIPACDGQTWSAVVLWQGKPLAGAEVVPYTPQGAGEPVTSDEAGRVALVGSPTRLAARVRWAEPGGQPGEWEGKPYEGKWHVATIVVQLGRGAEPAASGASIGDGGQETAGGQGEAGALLARARASRALWESFDGLTARIEATVDGKAQHGRLAIAADGAITLEGIDQAEASWIHQQLRIVVQHRMPSPFEAFAASFVDDQTTHPLGRLVRLVGEPAGSMYRIRDDVITEVHRVQGAARFTITVLDVARNERGQYLPTHFVVSYWDRASGKLKSTETYRQTWCQVKGLDLPRTLLVVLAGKDTSRVLDLEFADYELSPPPAAAGGR